MILSKSLRSHIFEWEVALSLNFENITSVCKKKLGSGKHRFSQAEVQFRLHPAETGMGIFSHETTIDYFIPMLSQKSTTN